MKTKVGSRDRGVQCNLIPPTYLGEESKFAPGKSTNPIGSIHPCLASSSPASSQVPITSKSGIGETCTPMWEQKKKNEMKQKKDEMKKVGVGP